MHLPYLSRSHCWMFLEHRQFEDLKSLTAAQKKKFMATQLNALGELLGGKLFSFWERIGRNRLEVVLIGVVGIVGQVSKMILIPPLSLQCKCSDCGHTVYV